MGILNGFDSMDFVKEIKHHSELMDIGITSKLDQDAIIDAIKQLNGSKSTTTKGIELETHGTNPQDLEAVSAWLNSIGFPQYFDLFIANGFDSMDIIKELKDVSELEEIGIDLDYQFDILNHAKLLSCQPNTEGDGQENNTVNDAEE